ncbi:MAG: UV DNA damage repair endonuclease UvsE [Methanomicrobiaceae archaeon]|nr:UV DNA damage repair endonuclease UvsE [Methanomicrobiaceae archaeon]
MRIGYPCINRSIGCSASRTFRLASYSEARLCEAVNQNIDCLTRILAYNIREGLLFFRISSDMIPFASHPLCAADWQGTFRGRLSALGTFIRNYRIRISMHPDQFILLNARDEDVYNRSVAELAYHAELLDLMGLSATAKIQLHVGGIYGDREESIKRFLERYGRLDETIVRRLVIENDDSRYPLADCLRISRECGVPVLFDSFHHAVFSSGEGLHDSALSAADTWSSGDGLPMVDYSSQYPSGRPGKHAEHLDPDDFARFLAETAPLDFDCMLEIKDKESAARSALGIATGDPRLVTGLKGQRE